MKSVNDNRNTIQPWSQSANETRLGTMRMNYVCFKIFDRFVDMDESQKIVEWINASAQVFNFDQRKPGIFF